MTSKTEADLARICHSCSPQQETKVTAVSDTRVALQPLSQDGQGSQAQATARPHEADGVRVGAQLWHPQDVVVHFGVGSSSVFLAQMQPQLTLVPEMQAAGVAVVRLLSGVDANMALESL